MFQHNPFIDSSSWMPDIVHMDLPEKADRRLGMLGCSKPFPTSVVPKNCAELCSVCAEMCSFYVRIAFDVSTLDCSNVWTLAFNNRGQAFLWRRPSSAWSFWSPHQEVCTRLSHYSRRTKIQSQTGSTARLTKHHVDCCCQPRVVCGSISQ